MNLIPFLLILLLSVFQQVGLACDHGLYLRGDWLSGSPNYNRIQGRNYRDFYIHLNKIGTKKLKEKRIQLNLEALRKVSPQTRPPRIQGWLGLRVCNESGYKPCIDLKRKKNWIPVLSEAEQIWAAGFDGIHLDFEPVMSGDQNLILILKAIQASKPEGKFLSIAGMSLELEGDILKKIHPHPKKGAHTFTWSKDYYKALLPLVDQVMVMNYDTALDNAQEYQAFTSWQTQHLAELFLGSKTELRIGIPVYQFGRSGVFNPLAENLRTAHLGIRSVWKERNSCPPNSGLAIFIEDEFKSEDQAFFWREW